MAATANLSDTVGSGPLTTTRAQRRKAFIGATSGHLIEWYDYGVYGFLAVYVGANFFPSGDETARLLSVFALFALSFFVRPLGGLFFGPLADKIGRRKTLMLVLGLMCGATALIGALPTYAQIGALAPILLVALRVVQGFSAGGEISTITAFVSEYSAKGGRGLATSYLMVTAALGLMSGAVVANGLAMFMGTQQMTEWGWRLPFLLAGVLGVIAVYIRMKLEDSPAFTALKAEGATAKAPLREALGYPRQLLLVGALIALLGSAFYLVMTYMTTYMKSILAYDPTSIFWLVLLTGLVAAAFMPVGGYISDRMGSRRPMLAVGAVLFAAAGFWFFLMAPTTAGVTAADGTVSGASPIAMIPALIALGITTGLYCGVPYATMSELLPARVRSTGIALGYNIPIAIFGGSAPFVATWLIDLTGDPSSPTWFFAATAVIALIGIAVLKDTDLLGADDAQEIKAHTAAQTIVVRDTTPEVQH